jgi:WD40 repeat protein
MIRDLTTGKKQGPLPVQANWRLDAAFLQGQRLATVGENYDIEKHTGFYDVKVWDGTKCQKSFRIGMESILQATAFNRDGSRLAVAEGSTGLGVRLWETATGKEIPLPQGLALRRPGAWAFSPNGHRLALLADGEVRVWDESRGQETSSYAVASSLQWVRAVFSPDGSRLAWTATCDGQWPPRGGEVKVLEGGISREARTFRGGLDEASSIALSPDGRLAAVGGAHGVAIWRTRAGDAGPTTTLRQLGKVDAVAFSPDGKALATAGEARSVTLWGPAHGKEIVTLPKQSWKFRALAFSPDGGRLAAACEDSKVRVWDLATRQEVHALAGHSTDAVSVAFTSDGRQVLSASAREAILWDTGTGRAIRTARLVTEMGDKDNRSRRHSQNVLCAAPPLTARISHRAARTEPSRSGKPRAATRCEP